MRKLTVYRKNAFWGAFAEYGIIVNRNSYDYIEYLAAMAEWYEDENREWPKDPFEFERHLISAGQTVTILIPERECHVFVTTGRNCSNELQIEPGKEDVRCVIETKRGWKMPAVCSLFRLSEPDRVSENRALLVTDVQSIYDRIIAQRQKPRKSNFLLTTGINWYIILIKNNY